jgi:hypothetical protein
MSRKRREERVEKRKIRKEGWKEGRKEIMNKKVSTGCPSAPSSIKTYTAG